MIFPVELSQRIVDYVSCEVRDVQFRVLGHGWLSYSTTWSASSSRIFVTFSPRPRFLGGHPSTADIAHTIEHLISNLDKVLDRAASNGPPETACWVNDVPRPHRIEVTTQPDSVHAFLIGADGSRIDFGPFPVP